MMRGFIVIMELDGTVELRETWACKNLGLQELAPARI